MGHGAPGREGDSRVRRSEETRNAGYEGRCLVKLDPLPASDEERDLKAGNTVVRGVLAGESLARLGQSNMAFPLNSAHNAAELLLQAEDAELRFFTVTKKTAFGPAN